MIKVIYLLKRLPHLTHAQFREHYENSHVKMAQKYLGHLMISYERNYCTQVRSARSLGRKPAAFDYDVITEWILPNEEALEGSTASSKFRRSAGNSTMTKGGFSTATPCCRSPAGTAR
jgi:hypothetical protein